MRMNYEWALSSAFYFASLLICCTSAAVDAATQQLPDSRSLRSGRKVRFVLNKDHAVSLEGSCIVQDVQTREVAEFQGVFNLINAFAPPCPDGCPWRYEPYYFQCNLRPNSAVVPKFVPGPIRRHLTARLKVKNLESNVTSVSPPITTVIHAWKPTAMKPPRFELGICVKGLYNFTDWYQLLIYLLFYQYLGAQHFYVYIHSVDANTRRILDYFERTKLVTTVPWGPVPRPIPDPPYFSRFEEIGDHSQVLSFQDCLLKSSGDFRYVALFDIDEFLFINPIKIGYNYRNSLVRFLHNKDKLLDFGDRAGGFHFHSVFVQANYTMKLFGPLLPGQPYYQGIRSKMILKPHAVEKMLVHRAWSYFRGYTEKLIKSKDAVLYHLREENLEDSEKMDNEEYTMPFSTLKNPILKMVNDVFEQLNITSTESACFY